MTPKTADTLNTLATVGEEPFVFRCSAVVYGSAVERMGVDRDIAIDERGCIILDARGCPSREALRAVAARLLETAQQLP